MPGPVWCRQRGVFRAAADLISFLIGHPVKIGTAEAFARSELRLRQGFHSSWMRTGARKFRREPHSLPSLCRDLCRAISNSVRVSDLQVAASSGEARVTWANVTFVQGKWRHLAEQLALPFGLAGRILAHRLRLDMLTSHPPRKHIESPEWSTSDRRFRFADRERFSKTKPRRTTIFQRTATSPLTPGVNSRVQSIFSHDRLHSFIYTLGSTPPSSPFFHENRDKRSLPR